jgi:hypothetical protein
MKPKELAKLLNGKEFIQLPSEFIQIAKENNLVVGYAIKFPIELYGAITSKSYRNSHVNKNGFCKPVKKYFMALIEYDSGKYEYLVATNIKHETFDLMRGKYAICRGIVFSMEDLK